MEKCLLFESFKSMGKVTKLVMQASSGFCAPEIWTIARLTTKNVTFNHLMVIEIVEYLNKISIIIKALWNSNRAYRSANQTINFGRYNMNFKVQRKPKFKSQKVSKLYRICKRKDWYMLLVKWNLITTTEPAKLMTYLILKNIHNYNRSSERLFNWNDWK